MIESVYLKTLFPETDFFIMLKQSLTICEQHEEILSTAQRRLFNMNSKCMAERSPISFS